MAARLSRAIVNVAIVLSRITCIFTKAKDIARLVTNYVRKYTTPKSVWVRYSQRTGKLKYNAYYFAKGERVG